MLCLLLSSSATPMTIQCAAQEFPVCVPIFIVGMVVSLSGRLYQRLWPEAWSRTSGVVQSILTQVQVFNVCITQSKCRAMAMPRPSWLGLDLRQALDRNLVLPRAIAGG